LDAATVVGIGVALDTATVVCVGVALGGSACVFVGTPVGVALPAAFVAVGIGVSAIRSDSSFDSALSVPKPV
jgi:hypothetical protein